MICSYRLIRYADDPERAEHVNVAIVVLEPNGPVRSRHIGDLRPKPAKHDRLQNLATRRSTSADGWVFQEWTYWLETLISSQDSQAIHAALDRLESLGAHFSASGVEEIELSREDLGWRQPIDFLYDRLVGDNFENALDELFARTELAWISNVTADAVLEIEGNPPLHFDYLVESAIDSGPKIAAYKAIQRHGVPESVAIASFNEACFSFRVLSDAGLLIPGRFAVITDDTEFPELAFLPDGVAVIGLRDKDADRQIRRIAGFD